MYLVKSGTAEKKALINEQHSVAWISPKKFRDLSHTPLFFHLDVFQRNSF